jgi:phenylpropionate dioxygenase-like ring-hydroxylating dioxygenase large terminal subunit
MHDSGGFVTSYNRLSVAANYQMIVDNLLDLFHVEYLHPFLAMTERKYEPAGPINLS